MQFQRGRRGGETRADGSNGLLLPDASIFDAQFLPHLKSGWHVDQAILAEEDRVVCIRFGHDWVGPSHTHFSQSTRDSLLSALCVCVCLSLSLCVRTQDPQCMVMDETLYSVAEKVQNFAVIYLCDITDVPDFNKVSMFNILRLLRNKGYVSPDVRVVRSLHSHVLL